MPLLFYGSWDACRNDIASRGDTPAADYAEAVVYPIKNFGNQSENVLIELSANSVDNRGKYFYNYK